MDSQDGKGMLGLLFAVLIVFAVMWLAVPWLQRSTIVADEPSAVAMLRSIHAAQQDLYGASRMYGSMGKLSNSKLVAQSQDSFTVKGYQFEHSTNGRGSTWCATAVPEAGKPGRTLGIDDSGSLYEGVSTTACYMGSLDRSGGSVVR
jgi:hypothetical protein